MRTSAIADNADSIVLAARPRAVALARTMVTAALRRWSLAQLAGDAEMVVSELVTNAVQATGSLAERLSWEQLRDVGMVKVQVTRGASCVLVEVWDSDSATPPEVRDAPPGAEGGRGLVIVDALAACWGHYPTRGGKVVWAQLGQGLPQRVRQHVQPYEPPVHLDAAVLHRVHEGLKGLV
jgi:anti-sigma regulatory factor (Ser/Thr protein kinase)